MKANPRALYRALIWHGWALLLGLWVGLVAATPARAAYDAPGRVGRVAEVQGSAWLYDEEADEWLGLQRNRPLTGGDRVTVDAGGRVELRVGSTTLRLSGGSQLDFNRLDDDRIDLFLHRGSLALRVRSAEVTSELSVGTPEGRFLPRRTGHYRIDRERDASYATTWSGELRFESNDSALPISPGQRAELWFDRGDGRTHYSWLDTERDAFSDWVARDSRDDDRSTAGRYVSPEMTGWEDLDRHGRWDTHPDYGAVWFPTLVVADWAPYRYGHWAWMRPWGWTWVDDAAWGFAPSHYGRWVHWRGRWCWAPGTRVPRPVFAPALVAWVGGPQGGFNLGVGGHPAPVVGWVPLAPREVYRPGYRAPAAHWRYLNPWSDHDGHPGAPTRVPGGPVHYSYKGVPGAVSVAPAEAMDRRAPVVPVRPPRDVAWDRSLRDSTFGQQAPPAPRQRVQPVPGGAVPVRPAQPPPAQPMPSVPTAPPVPTMRGLPPAPSVVPPRPVPDERHRTPQREPRAVAPQDRPAFDDAAHAGLRRGPAASTPTVPVPLRQRAEGRDEERDRPRSGSSRNPVQ